MRKLRWKYVGVGVCILASRADGTTQNAVNDVQNLREGERERNSRHRRYHHLTSGNK